MKCKRDPLSVLNVLKFIFIKYPRGLMHGSRVTLGVWIPLKITCGIRLL